MKIKFLFGVLLLTIAALPTQARLPRKISHVTVHDLRGKPAKLPHWGEKNLLIFYVDPDHHRQNHEFTVDMEENHRVVGENLYGFGVMNLKDAPLIPNDMACYFARKRTEKNKAVILADEQCIVRNMWELGDCNNQFVLMIVSKEGELVYVHKGVFTKADTDEFYRVVQDYR